MAIIPGKTNKSTVNFYIDSLLLLICLLLSLSGLIIQIKYHAGHRPDTEAVLGLSRYGWLVLHKISAVLIAIGLTVHGVLHINWFKYALLRAQKARSKTTKINIYLLATYTVTAITGFVAWLLLSGVAERGITEIHDKISFLLIIFFVMHIISHWSWIIKKIGPNGTG